MDKEIGNIIINKLSILPIIYEGKIKIIEDILTNYLNYRSFIENYFIINKIPYFKDNSLNYHSIPEDCRTNNFF